MKALKTLNTIALCIPLSIALLGIFNQGFLIAALVSTMLTGFIQVLAGVGFWNEYPENVHIKIYFLFVIIFFTLMFLKIGTDWYYCIPPALCTYLSILIYTKK